MLLVPPVRPRYSLPSNPPTSCHGKVCFTSCTPCPLVVKGAPSSPPWFPLRVSHPVTCTIPTSPRHTVSPCLSHTRTLILAHKRTHAKACTSPVAPALSPLTDTPVHRSKLLTHRHGTKRKAVQVHRGWQLPSHPRTCTDFLAVRGYRDRMEPRLKEASRPVTPLSPAACEFVQVRPTVPTMLPTRPSRPFMRSPTRCVGAGVCFCIFCDWVADNMRPSRRRGFCWRMWLRSHEPSLLAKKAMCGATPAAFSWNISDDSTCNPTRSVASDTSFPVLVSCVFQASLKNINPIRA